MLVDTHGPIINWITAPAGVANAPMLARENTRSARIRPEPSSANSALLATSRPWVAARNSSLRIVGSKASGIVAEDGLHIGVYNYLNLKKEPPPSATELIFDIDDEGVTPIFTWGKTEGRVYFPVPDDKGNGVGTCRLQINLLATPPSGDILLIGCANSCRGAFTDLAEGGAVRAEFDGKTYEWELTD